MSASSITATQYSPASFRPQPTDASVAAPAMQSKAPTAALRVPCRATKPPSHSGSGLFSTGRSVTKTDPTNATMISSCRTDSTMKPGALGVVARIAEIVEHQVHGQQGRNVPEVERHCTRVAD